MKKGTIQTTNPVTAARQAATVALKQQRQQTAANRILARRDKQLARYAKNHPLANYTTATSVTDPTAQPAVDNTLNQPNQVVQGNYDGGSTLGTNSTGGVSLTDTGSGTAQATSNPSWFHQHMYLIFASVGLVGVGAFIYFRNR